MGTATETCLMGCLYRKPQRTVTTLRVDQEPVSVPLATKEIQHRFDMKVSGVIPVWLIPILAEYLDIASLFNFMVTQKATYELIRTKERSISKRALARRFPLQPCSGVLSTKHLTVSPSTALRRAIPSASYAGLAELDLRARRTDALLRSPFLQLGPPRFAAALDPQRSAALRAHLARACAFVDTLSDVEAGVRCDPWGVRIVDVMLDHRGVPPGSPDRERRRAELMAPTVRDHQLLLIRDADSAELIWAWELIRRAGAGYERYQRPQELGGDGGGGDGADPEEELLDRCTAFEEFVLREGTLGIWAYARSPDARLAAYMKRRIEGVRAEMRAFEQGGSADDDEDDGDFVLPGLKMSIWQEMRARSHEAARKTLRQRKRREVEEKRAELRARKRAESGGGEGAAGEDVPDWREEDDEDMRRLDGASDEQINEWVMRDIYVNVFTELGIPTPRYTLARHEDDSE